MVIQSLERKIAVVAGASRGLGKAIALTLGELGATVYVTGRSIQGRDTTLPGTIHETAAQVSRVGGNGIPVLCDHTNDSAIAALFDQIGVEQGHIDILVNAIYPVPDLPPNIPRSASGRTPQDTPFWMLPISYFDSLIMGSLRASYVTTYYAAPLMLHQQSGLIVNISSKGAVDYWFNVPYGVDKAGIDKMTANMAHELASYGITVVAIRPPLTKTELVLAGARISKPDLSKAYSPYFTGRVVAALAGDPSVRTMSGNSLDVIALAHNYKIREID